MANQLNLPKSNNNVRIGALNDLVTISKFNITATIKSTRNNFQKTLEFLAVPSICNLLPDHFIKDNAFPIPKNIKLADPEFNKPAPIDVLIGAGATLASFSVGQTKILSDTECEIILQKTQLGWVLAGNSTISKSGSQVNNLCTHISSDISRFWELEEGPALKHLSAEEAACEIHFTENFSRSEDGRYSVALPFNDKKAHLIGSYSNALKRLISLEKRFLKNQQLKYEYANVPNDYLLKGYLRQVPLDVNEGFFLPHQAVFKETSLTTKLRIVFDGSCAAKSGISLNDALLSGPSIQDDIFSLLLRFRYHNYVLTGDIEKMYLQIMIHENDQKYLKILWRGKEGNLSSYQFNRLIFGLKPASFLATRCLKQLAEDEAHLFPDASSIVKRDLYMDDLLTGADSVKELMALREQICQLLNAGGFYLRQCASNSVDVLQSIPNQIINLQLQNDSTLKTLGIHWKSNTDPIFYSVNLISHVKFTKRIICSEIAKIFDPLGLLNPVVVTAKLILRSMWKIQLDWDESLPMEINSQWKDFSDQLPLLNNIAFDRKIVCNNHTSIQLHGFCDASEKAYGACIYLRSTNSNGNICVQLYCAKSKVAPIKKIQTIPRLELCAAVLLANLCSQVMQAIHFSIESVYLWSDSMVVLQWIRTSPHTLKTFVANRIVEIQHLTNAFNWHYVSTHSNPADLLSRGQTPIEFISPSLWTTGPPWLNSAEVNWPKQPKFTNPTIIPDARSPKCFSSTVHDYSILERFSSFLKIRKAVAICLRFKTLKETKGQLTVEELKMAKIRILQLTQQQAFESEINDLKNDRLVSKRSRLLALNPFLDEDGLIRVGGRLGHSEMAYQTKHPILLPKSHTITKLLIQHHHDVTFHGGMQATLYSLRQEFWPMDGRNQVRLIIKSCVRCSRLQPIHVVYKMGDLPKIRTLETRPFTNVGIDYCGPFYIKEKKLRNRTKVKSYVAIFICLSTKAVHLELVSDLTTEAFLASLKRFVARRGQCSAIFSDNARNFIGADRELKRVLIKLNSLNHDASIRNFLLSRNITWKFSPPQSPHFGGIWEAAVKSFKYHFKRVVGNILFTFEQLTTVIYEIEAILNSRPISPISSDPQDLLALTPGHFLIGAPLTSIPEVEITEEPVNHLSKWKYLQKMKQDFWKR